MTACVGRRPDTKTCCGCAMLWVVCVCVCDATQQKADLENRLAHAEGLRTVQGMDRGATGRRDNTAKWHPGQPLQTRTHQQPKPRHCWALKCVCAHATRWLAWQPMASRHRPAGWCIVRLNRGRRDRKSHKCREHTAVSGGSHSEGERNQSSLGCAPKPRPAQAPQAQCLQPARAWQQRHVGTKQAWFGAQNNTQTHHNAAVAATCTGLRTAQQNKFRLVLS